MFAREAREERRKDLSLHNARALSLLREKENAGYYNISTWRAARTRRVLL